MVIELLFHENMHESVFVNVGNGKARNANQKQRNIPSTKKNPALPVRFFFLPTPREKGVVAKKMEWH